MERSLLCGRVNVELINTGTELMMGFVLNTHQQWLCRQLTDAGYIVSRQTAVADTGLEIQQAVREAMGRARVIITTGGLGPTSDDRTRDMIAELLGLPLEEDSAVLDHINQFFASRHRVMPRTTRVQAMVPQGAMVLQNAHGTAPGLLVPFGSGILIMLPGPPRELRPMFTNQVLPFLLEKFPPPASYACCTLKTSGLGESLVEERIAPALAQLTAFGLEIGYCARIGEVDVRLVSRSTDAAVLVQQAEQITSSLLSDFVYGKEPEQLEHLIVRLLTEKRRTLALAESCTGGFIANRITNVPGASAVLLAGLVTYSNDAKQTFLGVKETTLLENGAVSEQVAREMAEGTRDRTGADFAISVTGIAGPTGGTPEKPVGTVHISLAREGGTLAKKFLNHYDRETFKFLTSQQALDLLRRQLLA
jgi:nicotinamide-nucleotide amidase